MPIAITVPQAKVLCLTVGPLVPLVDHESQVGIRPAMLIKFVVMILLVQSAIVCRCVLVVLNSCVASSLVCLCV